MYMYSVHDDASLMWLYLDMGMLLVPLGEVEEGEHHLAEVGEEEHHQVGVEEVEAEAEGLQEV